MPVSLLKILLLNEENLWDLSLISKVWFITTLRQNLWAFAGVNKSLTVTPSASSLDNALRIHKELYKKDLHDPDNQNGVITHREPDIMECEVKWALESITTNKASGCDGIPKKGNTKECSNYCTIALISHTSKVMLKILQTRLQQNMNCELPDVQSGFRKGRGTRDQIANIRWIIEKAREFKKNIYFWFIDYTKAFDCVDHNKLWKILKEMGISDHLTCLLRNLYTGQEATVRMDMQQQTGSK